jgi:uncharacterized protein (DUF2141 family)
MLQVLLCSLIALTTFVEEPGDLSVNIPNIKGNKGVIVIAVYSSREKFPKVGMEYRVIRFPANAAGSTFRMKDIKPGEYAVAMYHDENSDGVCNLNFLGIPKEGYGFSNNVRPVFSAPSFEDCKIKLTGDTHITVQLIY